MEKTIKINEECPTCKGTGLYVGMGERNGAAVVCRECKGTGCHKFVHCYTDFTKRKTRNDVKHVYEANVGIAIGNGESCCLEDFGGMTYRDWLDGKPFANGTEMRKYCCPRWWYGAVDYRKSPDWDACSEAMFMPFRLCPYFKNKAECWKRWDEEQRTKKLS